MALLSLSVILLASRIFGWPWEIAQEASRYTCVEIGTVPASRAASGHRGPYCQANRFRFDISANRQRFFTLTLLCASLQWPLAIVDLLQPNASNWAGVAHLMTYLSF